MGMAYRGEAPLTYCLKSCEPFAVTYLLALGSFHLRQRKIVNCDPLEEERGNVKVYPMTLPFVIKMATSGPEGKAGKTTPVPTIVRDGGAFG